jgi:hypothetical protein
MLWMGLANEVLSIYSETKARWIVPIADAPDPDAAAYIDALIAASATVTSRQRRAINDFIEDEKAASRWDLLKRIYLPIWGNHGPNAICLKTRTIGSFVGGVTPGAGFVQSNGTTGYLTTSAFASELMAIDDAMIGGLIYLRGDKISAAAIGGSSLGPNTCQFRLNSVSVITSSFGDELTGRDDVALSSADQNGILLVTQKNGTRTTFRRNSSSFSTLKTASIVAAGSIPANTFLFMALGASGILKDNSQYGMFFVGSAVSDANKMSDAMKTLWETCTGLTLP